MAACGNGETRSLRLRRIVPNVDPACGAPADARTLFVTALGDFPPDERFAISRNVAAGEDFNISSFPVGTRVLNVEVLGAGGALRTIGRTSSFRIEDLEDGDELSVFMAPPRGVCPSSAPINARYGALAAAVGDGIVIVGGFESSDMPVDSAEHYDPRSGTFTELSEDVYGAVDVGLRGATFTALPDGRAVLAGGPEPAWQLYVADGESPGFVAARFLTTSRAHHAAVALSNDQVLLVGGCWPVDAAGACTAGSELLTSTIINVTTEEVTDGPALTIPRIGGHAVREANGRVVLVGGVDGAGTAVADAERIDPDGGQANETIANLSGIPSRLASDSTLVAFSSPGALASTNAGVLPPFTGGVAPVADAPAARSGATLTSLEDGRVLVLGGLDAAGPAEALLYSPNEGRFSTVMGVPMNGGAVVHRTEHVAVRVDDGSVLIVGGKNAAGELLDDAWIFRPDLIGPFTSDVVTSFTAPVLFQQVVPRDPTQNSIDPDGIGGAAEYIIDSTSSIGTVPSQWAVVAGPEFVELSATVRGRVDAGGLAIMFSFRDAANYSFALFHAGQEVVIYRVSEGDLELIGTCDGQRIDPGELSPANAFVDIVFNAGPAVSATVNGRNVLSCPGFGGVERGLVGVGVSGEAGKIRIASLTIRR